MNRWILRKPDPEKVCALTRTAGISEISAGLLLGRGVMTAPQAADFFAPSLAGCHDPFEMKGMEQAVDVLVHTARAKDRIVVFGDYDVDGVTAVAQLRVVFNALGADSVSFIPHRVRDGYGLKPETFRKVFEEHRPRAIVTVDCGITAAEAVAEAARQGVSVVITDHHLPPEVLPDGASVVNPKQPGCPYPFKELCGAGVAFKIAQAIIRREKLSLAEDSLAKAAALGTIADIVPLLGENRAIVAAGLAGLARPRAPGLRELLREAGIEGRAPRSEEIAFRVGPRLNAAGRMDTAELALAVFEERDPRRAGEIARMLSRQNAERQQEERRVVDGARQNVLQSGDPAAEGILVAADSSWPRGVLGIAASRLVREFHLPVFLFSLEGEKAVGSARGIPGISLHELLSELRSYFSEFGGHAQACGGTVPLARFVEFQKAARQLFSSRIREEDKTPRIELDAEIPLREADDRLLAELEKFEPFGEGNRRPVFLVRGVTIPERPRPVGERGARGVLRQDGVERRAIGWGMMATWEKFAGQTADVLFQLRPDNYFGGTELEVLDFRPCEP